MTQILIKAVFSWLLLFFCTSPVLGGGTATGSDVESTAAVTGTITYRQRIALPPDAVLRVQLRDVSRMHAAAVVIAEHVVTPEHTVPIPFVLHYDPQEID